MRFHVTVLAAALTVSASSLMWAAPAAAATDQSYLGVPPVSTGSCAFKKTEYASSASFDESTSKTFVNLGDAGTINFNEAKTGCVAGTFFANAGNTSTTTDSVVLQVPLDGTACDPLAGGDYLFANNGTDFSSHAVGFFCGANVAPGSHTIQVQYASRDGGEVEFFQRTLVVTHK